jgi:hypothetical protein
MKKHLSYTLALALSVLAFTPQISSAQTQPTAQQQACVTPDGSDEAAYEEMGISHPKVMTRECFPDGSLKIWTKSSDNNSRVIEHDHSGKVIRDITVYKNLGVSGWLMIAQIRNSRDELIEQISGAEDTTSKKLPTDWALVSVGVYQSKKDTDHPLAVLVYNGNPTPIIVRKSRPDGKWDLQRYRPDGTMHHSMVVIGDGEKFENRKDYSTSENVRLPAGTVDPTWTALPNINDVPDLLPDAPPRVLTQVIDVNDHIPSSIPLHVGERLMVTTQNVPGAAAIASVVCLDSNGKGTPTLDPVPGFYPNSTLQAVQPGISTCTITYTHNPRDPKATLEGKTIVTVEP